MKEEEAYELYENHHQGFFPTGINHITKTFVIVTSGWEK